MRTITCDRCRTTEKEEEHLDLGVLPPKRNQITRCEFGEVGGTISTSGMLQQERSARFDLCPECRAWLIEEMRGAHRVK